MAITPIEDWPAHYGAGVISRECGDLDNYIVLTSPSAWRAVRGQFRHQPRAIEFITSQEEQYNQSLLAKLPDTDFVLGVGGGMALDAAKFVAWKKQAELILIPTIVSSGSVFRSGFPARRDGKLCIIAETVAPQGVLFDTEIIRAAPAHLNSAGMAECICWLGVVSSWRWWCQHSLPGEPWDQSIADETLQWVRDRVARFTADLDATGRPGPEAVKICAEVNRERCRLRIYRMKAHHAIDHHFVNAFTWVHKRQLLHGEGVALGTLINCCLCGDGFDEAVTMLKACRTRYLPVQIGCTWEQVRAALDAIPAQSEHLKSSETVLHYRPIDDKRMAEMAELIEGS